MPETRMIRPAMFNSTMRLVRRAGVRRASQRGPRSWAACPESAWAAESSCSTRSVISTFATIGLHILRAAWPHTRSGFLEPIADTVESFDGFEVIVNLFELLAKTLDVAIDGAVVDIHLIVVGGVHQSIAAFNYAGALGER